MMGLRLTGPFWLVNTPGHAQDGLGCTTSSPPTNQPTHLALGCQLASPVPAPWLRRHPAEAAQRAVCLARATNPFRAPRAAAAQPALWAEHVRACGAGRRVVHRAR
eukprot:scaffold144240_cov29-Tisochrysis_lutea.AAC.3